LPRNGSEPSSFIRTDGCRVVALSGVVGVLPFPFPSAVARWSRDGRAVCRCGISTGAARSSAQQQPRGLAVNRPWPPALLAPLPCRQTHFLCSRLSRLNTQDSRRLAVLLPL